jgi:hypothetical protein
MRAGRASAVPARLNALLKPDSGFHAAANCELQAKRYAFRAVCTIQAAAHA